MPKKASASRTALPLLTVERRPDIIPRQVGFDLALYDPATDRLHILNAVAAAVWHHITPDRTFRNITEALQLAFPDAKPKQIARDVEHLVEQLQGLELIVPTGSEPRRPKVGRLNRVLIPDKEIGTVGRGYVGPAVKSFTAAQLERLFSPDHVSVAFADLLVVVSPKG